MLPSICIYWLGGMMGTFDYYVSGRKRVEIINSNIADALNIDEKKASKITRKTFQNHLRNMLELMTYPRLNERQLAKMVHYEGLHYLDNALKNGKGVILLTAHFGAKQLLQVALGHFGYPLNQLNFHMEAQDLTYIQRRISQKQRMHIEKSMPVSFISAKGFLRPVYKCLKKNEVLIIAGDGIGLKKNMKVSTYHTFSFLGKQMLFPINYLHLAETTKAIVVPVFAVRNKDSHTLIFERPLNIDPKNRFEALRIFKDSLEEKIIRYPFLWEFWEEFNEDNLLESN